MRLNRIKVHHLRRLTSVDVDIDDQTKVICLIGANGTGKSALLSLMDYCIRGSSKQQGDDIGKNMVPRNLSTAEIQVGQSHLLVAFVFASDTSKHVWVHTAHQLNRDIGFQNTLVEKYPDIFGQQNVRHFADRQIHAEWLDQRAPDLISDLVFLHRPAGRNEIPGYISQTPAQQLTQYNRWIGRRTLPTHVATGLSFVRSMVQEIVLDAFTVKQKGMEEMDTAGQISVWAFHQLNRILKHVTGEDGLIVIRPWPFRDVSWKNSLLEHLSDGEKDLLVTAVHLLSQQIQFMRDSEAPAGSLPLVTAGFCIIDEIDTHLHPKAQGRAVPILTELFPGITFIISTHSPFVLQSLNKKTSRIIRMPDGQILDEDFSAWPVEEIVDAAFQTDPWGFNARRLLGDFELSLRQGNVELASSAYEEIRSTSVSLRAAADKLLLLKAPVAIRQQLLGFLARPET